MAWKGWAMLDSQTTEDDKTWRGMDSMKSMDRYGSMVEDGGGSL